MSLLIIGLSVAMLLFILAAGLTLIFGMLGIVNFAHGAFYMLGAYAGYQSVNLSGSLWPALVVGPVLVGLIGILVERVLLRPLYRRAHTYQLLITFGVILVIEEAVSLTFGTAFRAVDTPAMLTGYVEAFGSRLPNYRLFVIFVGIVVAAALFAAVERTRIGVVVRAVTSNETMARCLGIDVEAVRTRVFGIGCVLAGLAGVVAAPLTSVEPHMGLPIIIDSFIVVVVGGFGNIRGAVAAACLLGLVRALGQEYVPDLIVIVTYALLLAVLLFRPEGLFSRRSRAA